jgi:hypothetical protein
VLLISCSQDEGFGGNSHLKGVLMERCYNEDFSVLQKEALAKDEDIYLVFGDDLSIGDNTSTSYTGNFEFNYLWSGEYRIFYYSDDTTGVDQDEIEMITEIELGKGETYQTDTLYTYKTLSWDDGSASVKGTVMLINYKDESAYPNLVVKDTTLAQDYDIYITYNYADFYNEKISTQDDGTFVFSDLLKGHYRIFIYSEDVIDNGTADVVISYEVDITDTDEVIDLGTVYVEKI